MIRVIFVVSVHQQRPSSTEACALVGGHECLPQTTVYEDGDTVDSASGVHAY